MPREILTTLAFDSVRPGILKHAVQVQRDQDDGRLYLRIVQGVPNDDGTFTKTELVYDSADLDNLFESLQAARECVAATGASR